MGDYIKREDAIKAINGQFMTGILNDIMAIPAADVEPVRHGAWIDDEKYEYANCSECGLQIEPHEIRGYWAYCPQCGAKMDGGDNDD